MVRAVWFGEDVEALPLDELCLEVDVTFVGQ